MRNKFYRSVLLLLANALTCQSQEIAEEESLFALTLENNQIRLSWQSVENYSYFFQSSTDLENWFWLPNIRTGDGLVQSLFLDTPDEPQIFYRLEFTDQSPAETGDFDNDGLSNLDEVSRLSNQSDPFAADTDLSLIHI